MSLNAPTHSVVNTGVLLRSDGTMDLIHGVDDHLHVFLLGESLGEWPSGGVVSGEEGAWSSAVNVVGWVAE